MPAAMAYHIPFSLFTSSNIPPCFCTAAFQVLHVHRINVPNTRLIHAVGNLVDVAGNGSHKFHKPLKLLEIHADNITVHRHFRRYARLLAVPASSIFSLITSISSGETLKYRPMVCPSSFRIQSPPPCCGSASVWPRMPGHSYFCICFKMDPSSFIHTEVG